MDSGDSNLIRRKASVNTLLLKTLQLGALTVPVPERVLYRSQSDHYEHGEGGGTARRGRRTARKGFFTDRDPKKTERSIRDMIVEIESRARGGLASPRFAHELHSLPPEYTNWNKKKSPRRSRSPSPGRGSLDALNTSRPVVNIIGCQQSTELILSRADDRIRRQLMANELRDMACQQQRDRVLKLIADQETKAERIKLTMRLHQLQSGWLKILSIAAFAKIYKPMVTQELERIKDAKKEINAGIKVAHSIASWHQRKHAQRYLLMFRCVLASRSSMFLVRFRILYKRQCCKRIRSFFNEIKDRTKVSNMVHSFLESVRLIQKAIRNFIACRLEKIRSTMIIWDRLELIYIKV